MNLDAETLIRTLTDLGWSFGRIQSACKTVASMAGQEELEFSPEDGMQGDEHVPPKRPVSRRMSRPSDVSGASALAARIYHLLISSIGLSTKSAVEEILRELQSMDPERAQRLPPLSRKSFGYWVAKVNAVYTESELLRAASMAHLRLSGKDSLDWRLRK